MTIDPIDRAVAAARFLTSRGLDATTANIDAAFRALENGELRAAATPDDYAPPPAPYEGGLNELRAAAAPASTFEADYRAARLRDLEAMREKLDANEPGPRLTAAELTDYRAPRPYDTPLKALQEKKK